MRTIFGLNNFRKEFKNVVLVIGVFDGLHRGHRYLINNTVFYARRLRKISVCLTFHPHPQGLPYLISLRHRLKLIENLSVDWCIVIPFNKKFAKITAENFIQDILIKNFRPSCIFIGDKFRFGYKAKGDVALLKSFGKKFNFQVMPKKELKIGNRIISSNITRSLIKKGDLKTAEKFLGRRVSVLGTVTTGSKRARVFGYPTANIDPHHEVLPKEGVYAVKVVYPPDRLKAGKEVNVYNGLCNIGIRPTFSSTVDTQTIEVHLIGFNKNIYGRDLEIQFVRRLRSEKKFLSSQHLITQIKKDSSRALRILASLK